MKSQKIVLVSFSILIGLIMALTLFGQSNNSRRGADYVFVSDTSGKLFMYDIEEDTLEIYKTFTFPGCSKSVGNFDIQYIDHEYLIIANWECGAIYKFNLRTKEETLISDDFIRPIGVAVSKRNGGVYYVADQERGVLAYNARDGSIEILLDGVSPDGIALDPKGRVYFTQLDNYLYRVPLDGSPEPEIVKYYTYLRMLNGFVFQGPGDILVTHLDFHDSFYGGVVNSYKAYGVDFRINDTVYFLPPSSCSSDWLRDPEDVALDRNGYVYIIDSDFQELHGARLPGLYRLDQETHGACLEVLHQGSPFVDPVDILLWPPREIY